jgi:hydrogenase/urease accessory protein HupE
MKGRIDRGSLDRKAVARFVNLLLLVGWALLAPAADAHLLLPQKATLHLVGNKLYAVVSVPVSALGGIDDDRDGQLSALELDEHRSAISSEFRRRFRVATPAEAGQVLTCWAVSPQTGAEMPSPTRYVVVMAVFKFSRPVGAITLDTDLFGKAAGEKQLSIKATRDEGPGRGVELAVLDSLSTKHVFFRGFVSTMQQSIVTGIGHVLTGTDHLLFLLTVLVAVAGWRFWVGVVTCFTLAHSITLALAAYGVVHAPAAIVEPAIAASIVAMAFYHLARPGSPARWWLALVFGCGVLHGLGLASALNDTGLAGANRLAVLCGFNLGVELGQFFFVGVLLLVVTVARRFALLRGVAAPRLASATAALVGTVLLVQRLV